MRYGGRKQRREWPNWSVRRHWRPLLRTVDRANEKFTRSLLFSDENCLIRYLLHGTGYLRIHWTDAARRIGLRRYEEAGRDASPAAAGASST